MGKKNKHEGKYRSSSKKKHKKGNGKKHKKEKKSRSYKSTYSSDSDSSTSTTYDSGKELDTVKNKSQHVTSNDDSGWLELFSEENAFVKKKSARENDSRETIDKPGQSSRELNPYWKNGGSGLPPQPNQKSNVAINYGELKMSLVSQPMTSSATEDCSKSEEKSSKDEDAHYKHSQFLKPGEVSNLCFTNTHSQNWKKKDINVAPEKAAHSYKIENKIEETCTEKQNLLSPDELNELVARAMKAELMGDKSLSEQLKKEVEIAKENRKKFGASGLVENEGGRKKEEVVILMSTNNRGNMKSLQMVGCQESDRKHKRQKVTTHNEKERIRYFADDDKRSLKLMFEREKLDVGDQGDDIYFKMAQKNKSAVKDNEDFDNDFLDRVRCSDFERKESVKEMNRKKKAATAEHKSVANCQWCINNTEKRTLISIGTKCYLCLPTSESLTKGHCLILPVDHDICGTNLDEDTWDEIQLYRKALCKMFEDSGKDVIFYENARSFHRFPHMVLNCVPVEKEIGDVAPIYFKKAILESETEWSNNKKLIDLRSKDLRRCIPKGLPYFAVNFGREGGFAHVIEDEKLFPANFAEQIIGGMLDLDPLKFRKQRKESYDIQKEKVVEFLENWKKYDLMLPKRRRPSTSSSSSSN